MTPYIPLFVVPCELTEANDLVARLHRHHQPVVGHRFSLGVIDESGVQHGAAIVGRPVSRGSGDPRTVLEVTRLVTDGTPNACSMLYAAAARAGQALGFERIQTYIVQDEPGVSLRASGWTFEGLSSGNTFKNAARPDRREDYHGRKGRWGKVLNAVRPRWVDLACEDGQTTLDLSFSEPTAVSHADSGGERSTDAA